MYILKILQKQLGFLVLIAGVGTLNSLLYSGLLIVISRTVNQYQAEAAPTHLTALFFLGLMVVSYFSRRLFQTNVIRFTNTLLFNFELSILRKLRQASLEAFQKIGSQRVYTAIGDAKTIAHVPRFFVDVINNGVIIFCGLGYLFWVSPVAASCTVLMTIGLLTLYYSKSRTISPLFNRIRDLENDYYRYIQDLLHGFKELKMNNKRQDKMYQAFIEKNRFDTRDMEIQAANGYMNNELIGSYGWFFVIGIVLFVIPQFSSTNRADITAFVVVILYLIGPISALLTTVPFLTRINVSQKRLQEFNELVDAYIDDRSEEVLTHLDRDDIKEIVFEDVEYSYQHEHGNPGFSFGPINLTIKQGETLFVTGKNGSGKSTFLLLLTGLLSPTRGRILLNGRSVDNTLLCNQIAAVFVDAYLFSENYDNYDLRPTSSPLKEYADMLELTEHLHFREEVNQLDNNLSKGQRKRLAMIYALMEHKPMLMLDEWAAEQDPYFKHYFYETILPKLKDAGKTVIAVTHDDRYFEQADRVIQFDKGSLIERSQQLFGTPTHYGTL